MNGGTAFSERLAQSDAQQYLALYLIALLFTVLAAWPSGPNAANDIWFSMAYVRGSALTLLGLGYGVSVWSAAPGEQRQTLLLLFVFVLVALPLEVAGYAMSYPATPLGWVLGLPPLTVTATFGLGLLLGGVLAWLRLQALAPLAVVALMAGMVALDVSVGVNLLNPFTASVAVSWPHLALVVIATAATCLYLVGPRPATGSRQAGRGGRG